MLRSSVARPSDIAGRRRPRDAAATRQAILDAALPRFTRLGFRGTTVKDVADDAGVSPNLITRYFGGKDGLFLAATRTRIVPSPVLEGPRSELGARLTDGIIERWSGIAEDPMLILQRASGERPEAATALSDFLDERSLEPLRRYLRETGLPEEVAADRAAAIDAFVLGVSTRRRFLRADLGEMEQHRAWLSEMIQRLADD
jgi:AcrR family transcriptional regulator